MFARLLTRLERRFGRYALPGFTYYLVGLMAFTFVMELVSPGFHQFLMLDPHLVRQGEAWRLVTWLFISPSFSPIFALFALYWQYQFGLAFEAQWGPFKYQFFWLLGAVFNTAAAFAFDVPITNVYLLMSLFLGFATLFPDYEMVIIVFPVKIKWLALLDAAGLLAMVGMQSGWARLAPLLGIANYLLFFTPALLALVQAGRFRASRVTSAWTFQQSVRDSAPGKALRHCKTCEVTSEDPSVEFRVCTCSKCGGPTDFCLKHAREH